MPRTKCGFNDSAAVKGHELLALHGPTLIVNIGFDNKYDPESAPLTPPTPAIQGVYALVDTGATECCIDAALAAELVLPVIDKVTISGVGGAHEVNMHLAQIHIPSLGFTMYGSFAGVNLSAGGQRHRALIGRTFLHKFTMIYNGATGDVELLA